MKRTGNLITDDLGRTLILRGVNLGGSSKIPYSKNDAEGISFVGRPFPLEEAEEHFSNLRDWGLTFTRFIITWEALEHSGPGIYDEAYLDYLEKIFLIAEKKGINILIDPHQDVWSRMTGGDGAPAWTLEKLGMECGKLESVGAAVYSAGRKMIWPVNYSLYAAATMFTLFFGGNAFAPDLKIDGESAQDFLQGKYINAFKYCYTRLKNCKAIAGWGIMNEPHPGFIGYSDLRNLENVTLALGPVPNPFQAMLAASGNCVSFPIYFPWTKGWKTFGRRTINQSGVSLFKEGFTCPWKQAGIWSDKGNELKLLRPDHFSKCNGRSIRFTDDFLKPFIFSFMENMNKVKKNTLYFLEGIPHDENLTWSGKDPQNAVNAFHHYDGFTLFTKSFSPWLTIDSKTGRLILGRKKTAALFSEKLREACFWAKTQMDDMPSFLGEFGLPFDMNNRKAFKTGDYSQHEKALSIYYNGLDENLLGSTIWNYTADNTNAEGDRWNGEDLSIFSEKKPRAMGGWLRPYPMATAGIPIMFSWDRKNTSFVYRFRANPNIESPTEIFIPSVCFPENPAVSVKGIEVSTLRSEYRPEEQRLFIYNGGFSGECEVSVSKMSNTLVIVPAVSVG